MGFFDGMWDGLFGLIGQGANMAYDAHQQDMARQFSAGEAEKNRDFQSGMYNRQLSDSIDWRTHQEQYNSPEAQMSRFAEAGINPMYMVTGANGGTTVHTPSLTGGFGSTPVTPSSSTGRINVAEAVRLRNERRLALGQERMLDAQARVYNETADGIELDNARKEIESGYWASNAYQQSRSLIKANQLNDSQRSLLEKQGQQIDKHIEQIQEQINLNKVDVAHRLLQVQHQGWYTEFMQSIAPYEARKLQLAVSELEHNLNIVEFQDKMKKWSYWTDFGVNIVGSITQVIGGIKGLSFAPLNSVNHSFNKKVGNEIQSPETMMNTYDINY